jgi:hypothetical protein
LDCELSAFVSFDDSKVARERAKLIRALETRATVRLEAVTPVGKRGLLNERE